MALRMRILKALILRNTMTIFKLRRNASTNEWIVQAYVDGKCNEEPFVLH